jgi:hypothetical protein
MKEIRVSCADPRPIPFIAEFKSPGVIIKLSGWYF